MNRDLVQLATLGDSSSPWKTLLRAGAESLRDQAKTCPTPEGAAADVLVFFRPDDREPIPDEQARFLLETYQLRVAAAFGKRFPEFRLGWLLNRIGYVYNLYGAPVRWSDEELEALAGTAGRFRALFVEPEETRRALPPRFPYEGLDDPSLTRLVPRVVRSQAPYRSRFGALSELRARDPAAGRELLESVWDGEGLVGEQKLPAVREALLPALWLGLGPEDVPFLENALEKTSIATVRIAIKMLATLPNSIYYGKLRDVADSVLTDAGRFAPPENSAELKRIGFPKSEPSVLGARILGTVPLRHWEERFAATPEELANRIPLSDETEPIYAGWLVGFANFGAGVEWVRALSGFGERLALETVVDKDLEGFMNKWDNECGESYASIFERREDNMSPETATRRALAKVDREYKGSRRDLQRFLVRTIYEPTPWSDAFCEEYYRFVFENGPIYPEFERAIAVDLDMFPRAMRERIVATLTASANQSSEHKRSLAFAIELAKNVDESERLFGEFRGNLNPRHLDWALDDILPWRRRDFEGRS